MDKKEVNMNFINEFSGTLEAKMGSVNVGIHENTLSPYDMLLGGLGSCYYSTFLDIAKKKRINFDKALVKVEGEKRKKPPATLKWVKVTTKVFGSDNSRGLEKAAALAAKYCSIYVTVSKVADISWEIIFE